MRMKKTNTIIKLSWVLTVLVLTLSTLLSSCVLYNFTPEDPTSIPEDYHASKEEILRNISKTKKYNPKEFSYVTEYFLYWGFPEFDKAKTTWAENIFYTYYN